MKNNIYRKILIQKEMGRKMFAVLIDPEKSNGRHFAAVIAALKVHPPDFILIGGSHAVKSLNSMISILREELNVPVILFPGDASQFNPNADAMLMLSLTSGRNPDYLIGQQVNSALAIHDSQMEVIPTGYILIEGGKTSSVEYMSNTRAIPRDKKIIALSTALAGELMGLRMTYLEAGSGATHPVPAELIEYVRSKLSTPLIVGGGISCPEDLEKAYTAGADIVVVGNALEEDISLLSSLIDWVKDYNEMLDILSQQQENNE